MKVVYIHGHGASGDSFNFIRSQYFTVSDDICLEYDSRDGFAANLKAMVEQLQDESDIFFVAHSLGGIYATHLAGKLGDKVLGAVTMATPYGGCETALGLNVFWPQRVYLDIYPGADAIMDGHKVQLPRNWTAVVTTKGHSQMLRAANDGYVTDASMRNRRGVKFIEVASNHHEVIQSRRSVEIIKAALGEVEESAVAA